jgi:hypothetical protein
VAHKRLLKVFEIADERGQLLLLQTIEPLPVDVRVLLFDVGESR